VHDDARREEAGGDDGHLQHDRNVQARRQDPCRVHGPHREGRHPLIRFLAAAHLLAVAALTFLPLPIGAEAIAEARAAAIVDHNPILFATLRFQLEGGVTSFELRQLVGNFLLLLPLGIYGPILSPRLRSLPAILVVGAGLSAAIELGQLAVATAYGFPVRVADVDDVLLNTLGVLAGYLLWRAWSATASVDSDHALRGSADGR
jgi:glycopeptide antibiotics resistance protein